MVSLWLFLSLIGIASGALLGGMSSGEFATLIPFGVLLSGMYFGYCASRLGAVFGFWS